MHVDAATINVRTRMPRPDEADLLAIRGGTPVFDIRRRMLAAGRGSIVNIASMSASIVNRGLLQAHYNASKAGVKHLTFDVNLGPIT